MYSNICAQTFRKRSQYFKMITTFTIFFSAIFLFQLFCKVEIIQPKWKILIGIILVLEGFSITFLSNKVPWFLGLFLVFSTLYILKDFLGKNLSYLNVDNFGSRLIKTLTNDGRYVFLFPLIGSMVIISDIVANHFIFNGRLGSNDYVIIASGTLWILYSYIPQAYCRERDFIFLFINSLVLFLVIPVVFYNFQKGDISGEVMSPGEKASVKFFLALPLENFLNFLGYEAQSIDNMIHFNSKSGDLMIVSIAQGCSGVYSLAVFVSAFLAFILVEKDKVDSSSVQLFVLGIFVAYLANLFRMTLIILTGHYYGIDALEWVHTNIGWLIFVTWMTLFWSFFVSPVLNLK